MPFLARNTLPGPPPITDPRLFVADRHGAWHFQADLSTLADVDRGSTRSTRTRHPGGGADLWQATFHHHEFTGRSGTFFMFEGLGSIYWHMVSKLLLAVQACLAAARADPRGRRASWRAAYDDIRDGLGFRKTPSPVRRLPDATRTRTRRATAAPSSRA